MKPDQPELPQILLKLLKDILLLYRKTKWTTNANDQTAQAQSIGRPYITITLTIINHTTIYLRIKHPPTRKPPGFETTKVTDANYDLNDPESLQKIEQLITRTLWEHDTQR